ncbi:GTPase ObgE [Verrucomicrobia bacterium]|nr:GTPase ObgE [Verrucomicrobiota bacterium]
MFVDEVKIFGKAGPGGRGCIAFRREAHVPKGGPNGGDGGRGGSVILEASHDLNNLVNQYYAPHLFAKKGTHGMGTNMSGKSGKDMIIKVPCGTLVWQLQKNTTEEIRAAAAEALRIAESAEEDPEFIGSEEGSGAGYTAGMMIDVESAEEDMTVQEEIPDVEPTLLVDMTEHGQRFILCEGGRGGQGNQHYATARNQAPRKAQPGEAGEDGIFRLELRFMGDVGLIGYPNAGKSTLLTAISKARPKIAAYPFTTLHPQIGVLEYEDFKRLTVCDVPGIIEGAHENVGLGHAFLRHITRCKALVIILDMSAADGRDPWDDYEKLLNELEHYDPEMLKHPRIVAANKMDEEVAAENLKDFQTKFPDVPVQKMMAAFDEGIEEFKLAIRKLAGL